MMNIDVFGTKVAERVEAENCTYTEAAYDLIRSLSNRELGELADSSGDYEWDEIYVMAEIQSRTGAEWDSERYGEYYFDEQVYQAAVEGLIKGQYDDDTADSEHIPF